MTPERWKQVAPILDVVLEHSPDDHPALLSRLCAGDAALRADVERLLEANAAAAGFLEEPLDAPEALLRAGALAGAAAPMSGGTHVGPYRIIREIGRGGMGVVFLAERADGAFEQRVAVKVAHEGPAHDEQQRRFLQERQILANLDHPHIARLLDGGVTDDGRPYFVMEHIEGAPVTEYCARRQLGLDDRIRLFMDVCEAVEVAHRHLVVHRDLKPSNILVTRDGRVKLLDFGIAKLLAPERAVARTVVAAMTPEYAAPEQIRGDAVTTATDVYGLGVVLYELLSARRPYRSATPLELAIAVLQQDPVRPSTAVGDLPGEAASAFGVSAARLQRRLRGDLDTIALTALRKEPERRYQSAEALRRDLGRYLDHQPIAARSDSRAYRMRRFARRHALGVAAAATVALALLAGLAGTVWQARVASAQARRAEAAQRFVTRLFRVSEPSESRGRSITAREVLEIGAKRVETELADAPELQADLHTLIGRVYTQLGLYQDAKGLLERGLAMRRRMYRRGRVEIGESLDALGVLQFRQGDYSGAETSLREALAVFDRTVGAGDPRTVAALNHLADVQLARSEFDAAARTAEQALARGRDALGDRDPALADSFTRLAWAHRRRGQLDRGAALEREALELRRARFGDDHPDVVLNLASLGLSVFDLGRYGEAEQLYRQALAGAKSTLGANHPDTLEIAGDLAAVLMHRGNALEAEPLLRDVVSARRRTLGEGNPALVQHLAALAAVSRRLGRHAEAAGLYREALSITERELGPEHLEAAKNLHDLGALLVETGALAEAEPLLRRCIRILEMRLGAGHSYVGRATTTLGQLLFARGDRPAAERAYRHALDLLQKTLPADHTLIQDAALGLGLVLLDGSRAGEAEPLVRGAVETRRRAFGAGDARTAEAELALGECLLALGRTADAAAVLGNAVQVLRTHKGAQDSAVLRAGVALARAAGKPAVASGRP